jgi:hypothetical protein
MGSCTKERIPVWRREKMGDVKVKVQLVQVHSLRSTVFGIQECMLLLLRVLILRTALKQMKETVRVGTRPHVPQLMVRYIISRGRGF